MLQVTLDRLSSIDHLAPYVICNHEHRFIVAEQCREDGIEPGAIILEPAARNTAPAVAIGALRAVRDGEDPLLLVLPADHFIESPERFLDAVHIAAAQAELGNLVTFGVVPKGPETGYGYIKAGEWQSDDQSVGRIAEFVEKPPLAKARKFFEEGGYFWNSGMFLFKASVYLEELKAYRQDIFDVCERAVAEEKKDLEFYRPGDSFCSCPSDSIDYAVMEKTNKSLVVPAEMGWSDIGSWKALWEVSARDDKGNTEIGDVISIDTTGSYISSGRRLVAAIGLNEVVVVDTPDAVLVADKNRVQEVKSVVEQIRSETRSEHHTHTRVFRPWGSYESVDVGDRYQVKRITVNPGASLSLQMHHHRAEHWIVVRGTAKVERDGEAYILSENESTYIPLGAQHRLSNPGKVLVELIEVQVGSYLGEDDIVRLDDRYGRAK